MTFDTSPVVVEELRDTGRLQLYTLHNKPRTKPSPKVLLLGGSNFDLRLKRAFLNTKFALSCELITYEPRGIGRTEQPEGDWSMQDYALDALALLDSLKWKQVTVIGESFGGMTALHLALVAPERINHLVIAAATAGGSQHASYDIASLLGLTPRETAIKSLRIQDIRNNDLANQDPEAYAQILAERIKFEESFAKPSIANGGYSRLLKARRQHDCTARLNEITVPTTVIAGRYDKQAVFESQLALAEGLPNCRFHALEGGHGLLFALPEATAVATDTVLQAARELPIENL